MCVTHVMEFIGRYVLVVISLYEEGHIMSHNILCLFPTEDFEVPVLLQGFADRSAEEDPFL